MSENRVKEKTLRNKLLDTIAEEAKTLYKVSEDVALKEVNDWLNHHKVTPGNKKENISFIETIIENLRMGYLVLNADLTWTHTLITPIDSEVSTTELTYNRINLGKVNRKLENSRDKDDEMTRLNAYLSVSTNKPMKLIEGLSMRDKTIGSSIMVFFVD